MNENLNFYGREYIGVEVHHLDGAGNVLSKYDLVKGNRYLINSFFGSTPVTVVKVDYEKGTAETLDGNFMCFLEYDRDDRHCWVCSSSCNAAAIAKIEF